MTFAFENAVQANLLAATTLDMAARNQVYNVAVGGRTTLKDLYGALQAALAANGVDIGEGNAAEVQTGNRHDEGDRSQHG